MTMFRYHLTAAACVLLINLACDRIGSAADAEWVTVVPRMTGRILANPGMGWQTHHCTAQRDGSLPDWIPSTSHYARWGWGKLEPQANEIDTSFLDNALAESRAAGQKLALRVMCCSSTAKEPYHPDWLRQIGGKLIRTQYADEPPVDVPDLDDPRVLAAHLDFLRRMGARYDGHPDLDFIDLGSVGWWGEWHMSEARDTGMPSRETQKRIVDTYLDTFRKTPIVMLIGTGPLLPYGLQRGAGWRADCLGDLGGFDQSWCHMRNAYPTELREAAAFDMWKTAPVVWETCWDMRKWVESGWSLRYIFNYALALHGSYINNKSAQLPAGTEVRKELYRFLQRLGYRLLLREMKHPATVRPNATLAFQMKWQNVGSAPCYRPYRLAYRLSNEQGYKRSFVSDVTVNRWLPGSVVPFTAAFMQAPPDLPYGEIAQVADEILLPSNLPPGEYELALAVVGEVSEQPVVQLGIQGRATDGWYPLSRIRVVP